MLYPLAQPTLHDLVMLCDDACDGYLTAAREVGDRDLATLFSTLAAARRHMAAALCQYLDDSEEAVMHAPSPVETDLAQRLFSRLRSVLGNDPRRSLIERCERADRALARCLADTYELELERDAAQQLRLFFGEVTAALGLLAAARVRLS